MNKPPEFLYESDAHTVSKWELAFLGVLTILFATAIVFLPADTSSPASRFLDDLSMRWLMLAILGVLMGIEAARFIPMLLWGGTFRVTVADDRLRLESPYKYHRCNRSFNIRIASVERLVIYDSCEGTLYTVKTHQGHNLDVSICGTELFEFLKKRYPQIPREKQIWNRRDPETF